MAGLSEKGPVMRAKEHSEIIIRLTLEEALHLLAVDMEGDQQRALQVLRTLAEKILTKFVFF